VATYDLTPQSQVALETLTAAFFFARQRSRLGLEPVVVDAREVRLETHCPNQKGDRRDAIELGEGLRRGIYRSIVAALADQAEPRAHVEQRGALWRCAGEQVVALTICG